MEPEQCIAAALVVIIDEILDAVDLLPDTVA